MKALPSDFKKSSQLDCRSFLNRLSEQYGGEYVLFVL